MATIRGALGDDERGGAAQRDGRGVLWDDDILNGLDRDHWRDHDGGDDHGAGGRLYFSAYTPETGHELYRYDPQADEVSLAADIVVGPESSNPIDFAPLDGPHSHVADVLGKAAGKVLTLAELLDDGGDLPMDGPAGGQQQPVTLDSAAAAGTGPSVEDLVVAPENVVA